MNNKIKSKLNEMWTALSAYQPKADSNGHGESWALMCSERTEIAADAAWIATHAHHNFTTCNATHAVYYATTVTAEAAYAAAADAADNFADQHSASIQFYAQMSIDNINEAQGETNAE
jgi:hypothetical protein